MNPNENPQAGADVHFNEPPPKKSSWLKWLLGCGCGCLLVVGGGLLITFLFFRSVFNELAQSAQRGRMYQIKQAEAGGDFQVFVNSPNKLDGKLKENYVDFSFKYPKEWTFDQRAGKLGSNNFAEIDYSEDNYTHEHMSIGTFKITEEGTFDDEAKMKQNITVAADKMLGGLQKLGSGYAKFGKYDSYELRATRIMKGNDGGSLKFWFKIYLVKNPKSDTGVMAVIYATEKSEEVKSIEDVGVKGQLPEIVESFEFK